MAGMKYDLSALESKPIGTSAKMLAAFVMGLGLYAMLQEDKPLTYTMVNAFLFCVPSLCCLIRALRKRYQLSLVAACERIVAENDMQVQMARVQRNFGSIEKLREGTVFKNL